MSGFVFRDPPSDTQPDPAPPAADNVVCDAFWPAINLTDLRQAVRLNTDVTPERLRDAVRIAMLDMARELQTWRLEQQLLGHATLSAVPARQRVGDVSDYLLLWARGIYSIVAADIGERQTGEALTAAGATRAEALQADVAVHQRNVVHAVRDFLGLTRVAVALI
ncbi:MAG: head completion/stabilization protein [Brevundimonas sp.]|uniref:head completion/stabilization protein n=1 Tax=Brevundimonas sp. TaxID=1871086 RepID=UPI000DBC388D|nr:head completion/stabilization protein [Brevundimonas sp.]PZU62235.1 MAG: head completion/stabilization protein [Brevundimonas sp.]